MTIIAFRAFEEDIDTVAQSLTSIPTALAWPTNAFAVNSAQYLLDALGKAFPQRNRAINSIRNSISDLLASSLASPSPSVRQAARRAFDTMSDYYEAHGLAEKREALKEAVA